MASAIDPTKPVAGNPTTESVRLNFAAAKSEIEVLQQTAGIGPQGPTGPTGPSGTLTVGTVTTGAAGTSAAVTNSGTSQAAVLNFTLPRGDAGTGGGGITETQAKDAVRQGNVKFEESPETTAVTFPTTPNLAGAPVLGTDWALTSGTGATGTYTHTAGNSDGLAFPATISNGSYYQIVFTLTLGADVVYEYGGQPGVLTEALSNIMFRTSPTATTGQQSIASQVSSTSLTLTIRATGNFSHVVILPSSNWAGTLTMTRIVAYAGAQNSPSLSVKNFEIRARANSFYVGAGGALGTGDNNLGFGRDTLQVINQGTDNIAMGHQALPMNSNGSNNIAMGPYALNKSTSGGSNVCVGPYTGYHLRNGSTNVGVGYYCMYSTYSPNASYNVAVGYYCQYYGMTLANGTTPSQYNVAIGAWVGFRGGYNVGIGFKAWAHSSGPPGEPSGNNLIGIGHEAGSYISGGGQFLSAEDSILIGGNTRVNANGETNQTVIGHGAVGHGSNTITLGNDAVTAIHANVQTISALSDARVKENVQPANLDACLDAVKNLPVSNWDWLPIAGVRAEKHATGFMADDVAKVFPQAVTKEDRYLTVRDAAGKPQMTSVVEQSNWTPPDGQPAPRAETRQTEKTQQFKDMQYVSTAEMLPTLWAAVQRLAKEVEDLRGQASNDKETKDGNGTGDVPPRRRRN